MCEKLKEHFDIEINPYKLINEAKGVIARPHIAEAIVNAGYDYSFKYIFDNIIGDDSKAYIPSTRISTAEGVKLLRESDMVIVIAHPGLYKKNDINDLIKLGVDGIECTQKIIERTACNHNGGVSITRYQLRRRPY